MDLFKIKHHTCVTTAIKHGLKSTLLVLSGHEHVKFAYSKSPSLCHHAKEPLACLHKKLCTWVTRGKKYGLLQKTQKLNKNQATASSKYKANPLIKQDQSSQRQRLIDWTLWERESKRVCVCMCLCVCVRTCVQRCMHACLCLHVCAIHSKTQSQTHSELTLLVSAGTYPPPGSSQHWKNVSLYCWTHSQQHSKSLPWKSCDSAAVHYRVQSCWCCECHWSSIHTEFCGLIPAHQKKGP